MSHRSAPPLPVSTPAWLTPHRIALFAITAVAASAALPAVWWIRLARSEIGENPNTARTVAAITAILSLLLARRALRAESATRAVLVVVLGGILAGVLNAGLSCGAVQLVTYGDPGGAFVNFLAGLVFGGFAGGPLGLGFGVAFAIVVASASRAHLNPSHDGADRVLLTAGIWLIFAGAALGPIAEGTPTPVPPIALIGLGVPAVVASIYRLQARKRWLSQVARGLLPEYRIEAPPEDAEIPRHLIPIVRSKPSKSKAILLYLFRDCASPYRDPASSVPLALAELPPRPNKPTSPKRPRPTDAPENRLPSPKLPTLGPELRSIATDIFVVIAKTIGISLILLVFATAIAIPFVSCASVASLGGSYDLQ
jgi:hypothetical protein